MIAVPPAAKALAQRLGVEPQARAAWALVQPAAVRQDRRDMRDLRHLLAMLLARDTSCIDIGAHRGDVLRDVVRLAPDGRHIAYEPLPDLARELQAAFPTVDVRHAALSDRAGRREFVRVVDNPGWSGFRARPAPGSGATERLEVEVQRLDDAIPADLRPGFVKIDVEGAEREVLAGAMGVLREHQPVVAFEHGLGSADYYGTAPDDVWELLCERAGLRIFGLDGEGPYSRPGFREAFAAGRRVNFVAHR